MKSKPVLIIFALIGGIALLRGWIAYKLPLTLDEAYYLQWSRYLAWGYLDHPPGVALLGWPHNLWPSHTLSARVGALAVGVLTMLVTYSIGRQLRFGLPAMVALLLLVSLNIGGLAAGILNTPDAALVLCWTCALHEALAADRQPGRWLTFGMALGAGLLAKYIMILFLPPLAWALWRTRRATLRDHWLYSGLLVAGCVFLPHLGWNAAHDWSTIRFQLKRGFTASHTVALTDAITFPKTILAPAGSREWQLAEAFRPDPAEELARPERTPLQKLLTRLSNFLGGQLALWGGLIFAVLLAWRRYCRQPTFTDDFSRVLLTCLSWFPLAFFLAVAAVTPVEPNWPAVYMLSAAVLLSQSSDRRWLIGGATVNTIVILVLAWQAGGATTDVYPPRNRLSKETWAYRDLARLLAQQSEPLYASTYQMTAMTRFYFPQQLIDQWPGIARRSELSRNINLYTQGAPYAQATKIFLLVSDERHAHQIDGYELTQLDELRLCAGKGLIQTTANTDKTDHYQPPCPRRDTVANWYIKRYQTSSED